MTPYKIGQKLKAKSGYKDMPFASHEIEIVELLDGSSNLCNWLYEARSDDGKTFQCRVNWLNAYWRTVGKKVAA